MLQISFLETSKNQFQTHPPQKQSLHPLFNLTLLSLVLSVFRPFSSRIKNSLALPPALYRPIGSKSLLSSSKSRLESLALCLFTATIRDVSRVRFPSKGLVFTRPRGEGRLSRWWMAASGGDWRDTRGKLSRACCALAITMKGPAPKSCVHHRGAVSLIPPANYPSMASISTSRNDGSDNVTKDFLLLLFFFSFSRASKSWCLMCGEMRQLIQLQWQFIRREVVIRMSWLLG